MPNITQNPDYQLVMKFLQNIRPGDMDQESSEQLMMIGQRIQAGGALSDREREMFEAVVGSMPDVEKSYEVDGRMERMSPEMMNNMVSSGQISQGEAAMGMPGPGITDAQRAIMENEAYNKRLAEEMAMPSKDGMNYSPSSGVSMDPSVMGLQEMIDAGIIKPTRPQARPAAPATSMRPRMRP